MKITYNKNPLYTTIELDEQERKEFWYKIKLQEMENLLFEAHFNLEDGKYFNLNSARDAVDPSYYTVEEDVEKSKLDEHCDMLLNYYLESLQSCHVGDCTCVPCSCSKCHAESILGIDTIKGLGKHSAYKIDNAFGKGNEKSIDEAIESLANYDPKANWEGWEAHAPRWNAEAKAAHEWLVAYKSKYFK